MLCSRIDTVMHKKTNFLSVFWVHHDNTSKHPNTRMDYPKFGEYDHSVRTPPRSIVRLDSLDMFFGASNMSWHIKSCQPLCRFEFGGEFFAKQPTFAHICHGVLASVQFSIFKAFFRKKPPVIWLNCVKNSHRCNKGEVKLRHKGHNRCPSSYRVAAWRNPSFQVRMICRKPSEPKWMDPGKTVTTPYNFQSLNVRWDDFWSEAGSRLGLLLLLSPPLEPMEKISQSLDTSFLWFFDSKIGIEKKNWKYDPASFSTGVFTWLWKFKGTAHWNGKWLWNFLYKDWALKRKPQNPFASHSVGITKSWDQLSH